MRLHFLHNARWASGNRITADILSHRAVKHLALQSPGCIVCAPARHGSTLSSCILVNVDENHDENIAFEALFLSWLFMIINNDGFMESSEINMGMNRFHEDVGRSDREPEETVGTKMQ